VRNLRGRSNVYQSVAPRFNAAPRNATLQSDTFSLTLTWVDAGSAPDDDGVNVAEFEYDEDDQQTGGLANTADRSGAGAVGLEILTSGYALGSGPYTTDPVQFSLASAANRWIGAVVMWRVESGFGTTPGPLVHDDFDLGSDEATVTNGGASYWLTPYGHIANFQEQAWDNFAGPTSAVTIPELDDNTASACVWIIYALSDCGGTVNRNTYAEGVPDERVLRWNTTYTDELLIGCIGRVPGNAVDFGSPWSANTWSA
jgi:hypothetical protein